MPGVMFYTRSCTEEELKKLEKDTRNTYRISAGITAAGLLAYAAESLVRNFGGVEYSDSAKLIFDIGSILSTIGVSSLIANFVAKPRIIYNKQNKLEEKVDKIN